MPNRTASENSSLQRSLNEFLRELGYSKLDVDGHLGRKTRERIEYAKRYLGYSKAKATDEITTKFVRRLRHPRSARYSTPRMLAVGAARRRKRRKTMPVARVEKLLAECRKISNAGGPYIYGGGHGPRLTFLRSGQGLDCSSSVSLALARSGMFTSKVAWVSGLFTMWGDPGEGEYFTIWAHSGHVFIEFRHPYCRFDTSPHGDGGNGPRIRHKTRTHTDFVPRHLPGL